MDSPLRRQLRRSFDIDLPSIWMWQPHTAAHAIKSLDLPISSSTTKARELVEVSLPHGSTSLHRTPKAPISSAQMDGLRAFMRINHRPNG